MTLKAEEFNCHCWNKCPCDDKYKAHKEAIKVLRETVDACVGFSVAFREDNKCWPKHQEVGLLFAKATNALSKTLDYAEDQ